MNHKTTFPSELPAIKLEFYRGIKEISRFLGMNPQTVQKKLRHGLIPAKKDPMGSWVLCTLDYYLSLQSKDDQP